MSEYKCGSCDEPKGAPILADNRYAYARVSDISLSQNSECDYPGHILVLPKRHVLDRESLDLIEMQSIDFLIDRVIHGLQKEFKYKSLVVLEIHGERTEEHFHKHIIPGDGPPYAVKLDVANARKLAAWEMEELTMRLRKHCW